MNSLIKDIALNKKIPENEKIIYLINMDVVEKVWQYLLDLYEMSELNNSFFPVNLLVKIELWYYERRNIKSIRF